MVEIDNVFFQYETGQQTLQDICLHIRKGECILLCGESGCGKTTVTKLINGLIPHFVENGTLSGETSVAGMKVPQTELYELSKVVGSVFQNPKSQFFHLDSDSEIVFGLENAGVPASEIQARLKETVSALHIEKLLGRHVFAMSGGEKQTLAFASVYAMNPEIFVLDEPTANLDAETIELLRQQILQIKAEGRTVIIAEHRVYFLMDFIDWAFFLKDGKIERVYTGEAFRRLLDADRIAMGLRCLNKPTLQRPTAGSIERSSGLSVKSLCCAYEHTPVFSDLCFSVAPGEIMGIIGRNGAGKTTLTRCLCGLIKESGGGIYLDGNRLKPKQRQKLSFCVMQDVNHQLFSNSVWNECLLSAPDSQDGKIEQVLKAFNLLDYKDRHPMALSGGQKQRLAVATAILSDKKILIFDEPTSGLDYRRMIEVSDMVRLLRQHGKIILIVSHDLEFLNRTCDTIMNMNQGNGRR